ncbi:hypothetical protein RRF57_003426 [Xylaria bambusicola]|uniref:Uncharacterized protein n=1 Tax=Xylaria bambusicola TaxID=326684 RepID=A0AAN7Z7L3_9PEZI
MALRINPITAQLGKLSIGSTTSRTGIRLASTTRRRKGERIEPSFLPGHGEKIYVFNHFRDGMTVYSHDPVLKVRYSTLLYVPPNPPPFPPNLGEIQNISLTIASRK